MKYWKYIELASFFRKYKSVKFTDFIMKGMLTFFEILYISYFTMKFYCNNIIKSNF